MGSDGGVTTELLMLRWPNRPELACLDRLLLDVWFPRVCANEKVLNRADKRREARNYDGSMPLIVSDKLDVFCDRGITR